ncbi:MAG: hypothetical protein HEP71_29885 [Roseivirga sp.]|nr:hypothetical protein [Roseivirga sp.]
MSLKAQADGTLSADSRKFEGLYIGINSGTQSIFSTATINELSVPGQSSRWTAEFLIAHRWQFLNNRIVFGLEVQVGLTDGNLDRTFNGLRQLEIHFSNNSQTGLGYTLGYVAGEKQNLLLYTYLYQTRRNFDISLKDDGRVIQWQRDIQTVLRFGLGLEYNLGKRFSTRLTVGSQSPDLNNDIDIEEVPELTLGFIYQF